MRIHLIELRRNMKNIVFESTQALLEKLANELQILSLKKQKSHISLSGGSTPNLLFDYLATSNYANIINWQQLHFWWGDERCVPAKDPESNYGQCKQRLFDHIQIPVSNIHRIQGENLPTEETKRYTQEIQNHLVIADNIPQFDWIILGVGEDGHTASIFPKSSKDTKNSNKHCLYKNKKLIFIATHPQTKQLRISKTAYLIEHCKRLTYLVIGENKADIVDKISSQIDSKIEATKCYPAARITSNNGITEFYLDSKAA